MKKIILKGLFLAFLFLGLSFVLPASSVRAETGSNGDQTDVTEDESDIDEDEGVEDESDDSQDDSIDDQDDADEDEDDVNDDIDDDSDEDEDVEDDEIDGEEHRSAVETVVQDLLKVADQEKGEVGEEVKSIAEEKDRSKDDVAENIDEVKNRSGLKTFFIGTDFKNLGELRSETVKTENQIEKLSELSDEVKIPDNKTTLEKQIETLKELQQNIIDFIKENESKFSLFGWFAKLFVQ